MGIVRYATALCALTVLCACNHSRPRHTARDGVQTIEIEVVAAAEHLGHDLTESGGHSAWCDGCRARLVATAEPFVIYWTNDAIRDSRFRFKAAQRYRLRFTGDVGTGVMAYQGKCIELGQVVELEEE